MSKTKRRITRKTKTRKKTTANRSEAENAIVRKQPNGHERGDMYIGVNGGPVSNGNPPRCMMFTKENPRPGPGRPKGSIVAKLREVLHEEVKDPKTGKKISGAELLARTARQYAAKGNFAFWQAIVDRIDGPLPRAITGDPESPPIRIEIAAVQPPKD